MKHIILGYILLSILPSIYKIQMTKMKKPFENKLGVIVFSFAGFLQVFIGLCKLSSEGIKITELSSYSILGVAFFILCAGTVVAIITKKQKTYPPTK